MVGWHHRLDGHGFEQTAGYSEGQGSLECYNPWDLIESDTTERLNNNKLSSGVKLNHKKEEKLVVPGTSWGGLILETAPWPRALSRLPP